MSSYDGYPCTPNAGILKTTLERSKATLELTKTTVGYNGISSVDSDQ